jgi:uncharacterized protein (TIGR04255 family)
MSADQYKNPPIEEALCQFTFSPSSEAEFLTLAGKLQSQLPEYSGEPRLQQVQTIVANQTAQQPNISLQNDIARIQLLTPDTRKLVAVGRDTLSVNILRPYTGWDEDFRNRIEAALTAYYKIVSKALAVTRIGVRYINRIVVPVPGAVANNFFRTSDPEDALMQGRLTHFAKRLEYAVEGPAKIVVTHATIAARDPKTTEFLLDIDAIWDSSPIADLQRALKCADDLHERVGVTFESLITDNARELFNAS